jgi:hypothetical protein
MSSGRVNLSSAETDSAALSQFWTALQASCLRSLGNVPMCIIDETTKLVVASVAVFVFLMILRYLFSRQRIHPRTLVVLGSGGHTSEMLSLLTALPPARFSDMVFMVAKTDTNTEGRLMKKFSNARVIRTPRAREVRGPKPWLISQGKSTQSRDDHNRHISQGQPFPGKKKRQTKK